MRDQLEEKSSPRESWLAAKTVSSFFGSALSSLEQQRRESDQVISPNHPGVRAGRFDVGEWNILRLEPGLQLPVIFDEAVAGAAGDPKRFQLSRLLRFQSWK